MKQHSHSHQNPAMAALRGKASDEIFMDIPDAPGYKISTLGRAIGPSGKFLKPQDLSTSPYGRYQAYAISINGKVRREYIHRLVAKTFIAEPPADWQVNHINTIRHDNRLANLEIISPSDNKRHGDWMLTGDDRVFPFIEYRGPDRYRASVRTRETVYRVGEYRDRETAQANLNHWLYQMGIDPREWHFDHRRFRPRSAMGARRFLEAYATKLF